MEWEARELLGLWLQQFIIQPISGYHSYNTETFKRDIFSHLFKNVHGIFDHGPTF